MSVYATAWAKRQRTGDPTMKHVLVAVADYADEDGEAWPSQERLAFDTELSVRSIARALKRLETAAFLSRRKRHSRPGANRQSDVITLAMNQPDILSGRAKATGHTVQTYRSQCPPNHHRNHHRSSIQGGDLSRKGSTREEGRPRTAPVDGGEASF